MKQLLCILALLFACNAKAEEHEHLIQPDKVGTASVSDGWRHELFHAAALAAAGIQSSYPQAFIDEAVLWKAEFDTEMKRFNDLQATRDHISAKQGMDGFYAWRDSHVGNHWVVAASKMNKWEIAEVEEHLNFDMARMRSTNSPKHEVASLAGQYPNNGTETGCGPDVTCNITYSLAISDNQSSPPQEGVYCRETGGGGRCANVYYLYQPPETDTYDSILDGGTTMNCPPACQGNPVHTPHVQLQYNNGTTYTSYGNGACGNCYLYASGVWSFATQWGTIPTPPCPSCQNPLQSSPVDINDGGQVVCNIAGGFAILGFIHWPWEKAYTMTHIHSTIPFSTTTGTWVYPDLGSPRNPYNDVAMGYYTQDDYCMGLNLNPPVYPDLDMRSFLTAMPQVYVTGGTLLSSSCGHSFQSGCPTVQQEGIYAIATEYLWRFPGGSQWYITNYQASQLAYPNRVWEKPLYFWTGEYGSAAPRIPDCTFGLQGGVPAKVQNLEQKP
jgi:hypothetical protein